MKYFIHIQFYEHYSKTWLTPEPMLFYLCKSLSFNLLHIYTNEWHFAVGNQCTRWKFKVKFKIITFGAILVQLKDVAFVLVQRTEEFWSCFSIPWIKLAYLINLLPLNFKNCWKCLYLACLQVQIIPKC
jgi:hypothetical protein